MATTVLEAEAATAPATSPQGVADELTAPTHEDVAELAYSYWEARGRQGGSAWEDWFRAEQELLKKREL